MSDPDQAAAAGAMSNKLMSNEKVETTTTTTAAPAPAAGGGAAAAGGTPTTTSNPGELAQAQDGDQAPHKLGWKESEKLKQLLLYDLYKGLINTDGVVEGALPKHLDSRFSNIPV